MKRGHRPRRTCLGCGKRDDQEGLLRFVAQENGRLRLDRFAAGRGGYLHRAAECWNSFLRKRSLYRALHAEPGREEREKLLFDLKQSVT